MDPTTSAQRLNEPATTLGGPERFVRLPPGCDYVCGNPDRNPALEARATSGKTGRTITWPNGSAM